MKRILLVFWLIWICTVPAFAADLPHELVHALPEQAESLLKHVDYDLTGGIFMPIKSVAIRAMGQVRGSIRQQLRGVLTVFLAVLLCSMAEGFYQGLENQKLTAFLPMVGVLFNYLSVFIWHIFFCSVSFFFLLFPFHFVLPSVSFSRHSC